ncbi:unnamed protein product [Dicrocoelium dendriticum]|nr:unnamed protein product [Dicrocoelium dendriticum]
MSDKDKQFTELIRVHRRTNELSGTDEHIQAPPNVFPEKPHCTPRFVILGMPSSGKSELARRLCSIWGCEYVNASNLLQRHISSGMLTGSYLSETMQNGNDLQDSDVLRIIFDKLDSDECRRSGYVLDDYPTNSQKYKSITEQLKILCTLSSKPNCYIYVNTNQREHFCWWAQKRIDPKTGCLYQPNDQGIYERNTRMHSAGSISINEEPALYKMPGEQLLTRHEDLAESIEKHLDFYKTTMQPALAKFLMSQRAAVIHVHSRNIHEELFTNAIQALYNNSEHPELRALDLFGEKENEDSTKTDTPQVSTSSKKRRWKKLKDAFGCSTSDNEVP